LLAYKILEEQGIDVTAVFFKTYFFSQERAREVAKANNVKLRVEDISDEHLEIVKKPRFGFGKRRNPCIDCHMLMIKKAKEVMEAEGFDFIATGEVLGQRPMSQNITALRNIEKELGLEKKIVRPLSAKLLPITEAEEKGLIDREKLYGIRGRGRETQLDLVWKMGIKKYESPAGGCLLTDPAFSERLKDLAEHWPSYTSDDVVLVRNGRVFWQDDDLIIVGRDQDECERLRNIKKTNDIVIDLVDVPGPTTIIRGKDITKQSIDKAIELTIRYARKADDLKKVGVKTAQNGKEEIRQIVK